MVALVSASGANCPQMVQHYTQPLPRALPPAASLDQVIQVVNDNSAKIQSFSSSKASISTPGFPSLRANLAFERPRNFRLRGDTLLTGPEVDLGSNGELFWTWVRRMQPPALYFCRHEQFATSPARQMIPIEPEWLIQALGVVSFEPTEQHQGPFPVGAGRVEIRSSRPSAGGSDQALTRITIIDDSRGVVLEQHLYDQAGQPLAMAILSRHTSDPISGATMPRHVDIKCPPARFELTIDLSDVQINQPSGEPQVWIKPQYPGYTDVDLANIVPVPQQTGAANAPAQIPPINVRY
jgi:hypothetical protein